MIVDGVEADYEECAVAVDGSAIWRNGVRYVPEASGRYCSYCDGTGIVPGSEGQVWARGVGWHWPVGEPTMSELPDGDYEIDGERYTVRTVLEGDLEPGPGSEKLQEAAREFLWWGTNQQRRSSEVAVAEKG